MHAFGPEAGRQCFPVLHGQDGTEMPDGHLMPIHLTGAAMAALARCQVGNKLMAKEIEIHPVRGAAPLGTSEKLAVEAASL